MSSESWTPNFGNLTSPPPDWAAKRPVRIALLGDFSAGALRGRLETGAALAKRKPLKVEFDSLDDAIRRLNLSLPLPVGADGALVEVAIEELESFHPDSLYGNVELFTALSQLRRKVNAPATFAAAAAEIQSWGGEAGAKASRIARRASARGSAPAAGARLDDFARLTGRAGASADAETDIGSLLKSVVGPFVVAGDSPDKAKLLTLVDEALADAMRAVLHQADFQNTEALWRGVDFLLRKLETGPQLQVHLIDISAEELAADLSSVDDLSESGLYQLLAAKPAEEAGGGYAYLAGCYQFEATPPHAELLGRMANVAAHAGAPFITSVSTDVFVDRREPPHRLIAEAFAALKTMPNASFLALIGPRFMLRYPYGKKSDPISSFTFEEFSAEGGLRSMLWGHPALLALSVLAVPGGQLAIDDIPFYFYTDAEGDSTALPCTDRLINVNVAALLRSFGINAVMAHKGAGVARLAGLSAINDDGLALSGAPKKAAASRMEINAGVRADKTTGGWSAQVRSAGPAAASAAPAGATPAAAAAAAADEALTPEEAPLVTADTGADDPGAGGVDDELAALLASLDAPAEASPAAGGETAEAPAEDGMDPELAALLASLG